MITHFQVLLYLVRRDVIPLSETIETDALVITTAPHNMWCYISDLLMSTQAIAHHSSQVISE